MYTSSYQYIEVIPLTSHLGAIISGIDLSSLLKAEIITEIKEAFRQYQLLLFRGKTLSPKEQVMFSNHFGELETFPYTSTQIREYPEIFRLSNRKGDGYENVGFYWHADGSFKHLYPTAISLFHIIDVPVKGGGDTLFTNMYAAFGALPFKKQYFYRQLATIHKNGIEHKLVITHPVTGKEALYINLGLNMGIVGIAEQESDLIFKEINQHLNREGCTYAHQWQPGDLLMSDNYSVAHQATHPINDSRRTLHRTTVRGNIIL
jgi:taurine dioxygenase